jgi:hypothetical protein
VRRERRIRRRGRTAAVHPRGTAAAHSSADPQRRLGAEKDLALMMPITSNGRTRTTATDRRMVCGGARSSVLLAAGLAALGCAPPPDAIEQARGALTAPPAAPQSLVNIALNPSCAGLPSTEGTDRTWGCSNTCDLLDGLRSYPDWCHGHAFTGGHADGSGGAPYVEPAGPRHLVVNFARKQSFEKVVLWWHGIEHTPDSGTLEYWDDTQWVAIPNVVREYGTMHEEGANSGYSDSDIYTFAPVAGSKLRYTFNNSGGNMAGTLNIHGWLYEVEVFGNDECPSGVLVPASLHSDFGVFLGSPKPFRIGLEDVYPTFTARGSGGRPGVLCHLESHNNTRTMTLGPRAPWPLPGPLPAIVPIGTVAPDVDLDFYTEGGHAVPAPCSFTFGGLHNDCLLNAASAAPLLVNWTTPGFRLNVLGIRTTLAARSFWVDLAAIPGVAPGAALSVTVDAVEDVVEAAIAANIVYAQSWWALVAEPPLDVRVTDPGARRTGPTDDGSVVTEIPGSMHVRAGDVGAVLMFQPMAGTYAARIVGDAGDPFLLSISTADFTKDEMVPVSREWSTSGTVGPNGTSFDFTLADNALVIDGAPPTVTLRAEPGALWPPNGRLQRVRIDVAAADDTDPSPKVVLESVTCDDGCRPGADIAGAALGTDDREVLLRAEWRGARRGRTYTLTYAVSDAAGNVTRKSVTVTVAQPHGGRACDRPGSNI